MSIYELTNSSKFFGYATAVEINTTAIHHFAPNYGVSKM